MLVLKHVTEVGKSMLTLRRTVLAGAALLGLYAAGDHGLSYLSTASRMAGDEVSSRIPVQFELERARTMINALVPDIKRNMIVIAKEEVSVESIRREVDDASESLTTQRTALLTLKQEAESGNQPIRIRNRPASKDEIDQELKRRLARYKLSEATLDAKKDLLANRELSLDAARAKLERMVNAKRDLEMQVENLQARLHTVESESVTQTVDFDETGVAKCQKLVDALRVRLQVAERLITTADEDGGHFESAVTVGDEDVYSQIDEYFSGDKKDHLTQQTW